MGNYMQPREILSLLPPPEKLPTQNETHLSTGHPTHCDGYLVYGFSRQTINAPSPIGLKQKGAP
jgi:hypothetical protein